jgi:hypothetical protein
MRISTTIKALLAVTAVTPLLCHAESNLNTGGGSPLATTAHVDFQVTIPKFVFLRIGTGTGTAAGGWGVDAAVDLITFAPTPAQVGTGLLGGTGGDLTGGVETAVVVANGGDVTFSSTASAGLSDGAGDLISWATILTTAAHNSTGTTLQAPALANGTTTSITLTAVGKVVQQDAKWTFQYANGTVPPAGTYGGVNVNGGRVTYTASVL